MGSLQLMSWAWEQSASRGIDRFVLVSLAASAGSNAIKPNVESLAFMTGLSNDEVSESLLHLHQLRDLIDLGEAGVWLNAPGAPPQVELRRKAKISAALRRLVYERDRYVCVDCGTHESLSVDHIYPEFLGGPTELDNLETRCRPCNSRKGVSVREF